MFFGRRTRGAFPGQFRLFALHVFVGDILRIARIDLNAGRTRSAESNARELQAGRSATCAGFDEVHRIFVGTTFLKEFQPIIDGADRGNDVVADAAARSAPRSVAERITGNVMVEFS